MHRDDGWIDRLFAAIDGKDLAAFAEYLAADASFRFGNSPPVQGRAAISETVGSFFSALRGLKHRVEDRWITTDAAIVAGSVTYARHDGSTLQVPFANILKLQQGRIRDYRIFIDISALFPAVAPVPALAPSPEP